MPGWPKRHFRQATKRTPRSLSPKNSKRRALGPGLATAYAAAHENAVKMREMHDKLVSDIETLRSRRESIKAKVSVAKTQQKVNEISSAAGKASGAMSAFDRMEEKANRMLDEANAMAQLNTEPIDEAKALEEKYSAMGTGDSVDAELEKMKKEMGLDRPKPLRRRTPVLRGLFVYAGTTLPAAKAKTTDGPYGTTAPST